MLLIAQYVNDIFMVLAARIYYDSSLSLQKLSVLGSHTSLLCFWDLQVYILPKAKQKNQNEPFK